MSIPQSKNACPECQAELPEGARFCWLCGAAVSRPASDPLAGGTAAAAMLPEPQAIPIASASGPWIADDQPQASSASQRFAGSPSTHSTSGLTALLLPLLLFVILLGVWS